MMDYMFSGIAAPVSSATPESSPGPVLVEPKPKQKKVESIWPTGYAAGEQMRLFG